MGAMPTYLRVVVTTRCNHRCDFCHREGDPHARGTPAELSLPALEARVLAAVRAGVRKVKLLGGEPFLRRDLPSLIAAVRAACPAVDLSVITAGAVPVEALLRAYDAGLTRVNVSIHGFTAAAHARTTRAPGAFALRQEFLAAALAEATRRGVPLKLNYVFGEDGDRGDLAALLTWSTDKPVVVGLLDDLGADLSWRPLAALVEALRGPHATQVVLVDPASLPTLLRRWPDGLRVEFKHLRLGEVAPYVACPTCPARARCKEGITALRLTHRGLFQPCMDRPDAAFDLGPFLGGAAGGDIGAAFALRAWARSL
ncbi:MAG: radical SAM protein [Deltaproteobacteria bacterium]|nr:radical SAM protein [Deltaproteobacteria bacterium]